MDPAKVRAVYDWPVPGSRNTLQGFLDFANFYGRFIKKFSQVAAPLSALTSTKTKFSWSSAAQAAFDDLKSRFTTAPILILPDPSRRFVVEIDASEVGVGAVLSQKSPHNNRLHPCAFFFCIAFLPQNEIMTSATESCWLYAWLWESGIIGWRGRLFHFWCGRIIEIWSTFNQPNN